MQLFIRMIVTVHLHTILQRQTENGMVSRLDFELPEESTLEDLIQFLEINLDAEHMLLAVNHRVAEPSQLLVDGDVVNLMPALSGG